MALFGIGGSKSKSKSTSESYAQSTDQSRSVSSTSQSVNFNDIFGRLFGSAEGATANAVGMLPEFQDTAASLFTGGTQFLDNLVGPNAGSAYMERRLNDTSVLDEQIGALQSDLGRMFNEELLPGITSGSVANGTLGGSRQGVAQGIAAEGIARQFAQGAASLRGADLAARDQLAGEYAAGSREGNALALDSLAGLTDLAGAGIEAELMPYEMLAKILGPQNTLTESLSVSESSGQSTAKSTSKSKSKSGSFNFGFG